MSHSLLSLRRWVAASLFTGSLLATGVASAQYQKGPDPTVSSLEASSGPFSVRSTTVSRASASGFGGGTVYYPTASGSYGAIAVSPGFTAYQSSISWIGSKLASHGFVVITIDTITTADQPDSRGRQLKAALDKVVSLSRTSSSPIYNKVDANRLGVAGHSMGGGGTLEAARDNPQYKAAVPLAPWNLTKTWSRVSVPTLIIGGESDTIAAVATHSIPFYSSLPGSTKKGYMELNSASHFFPQLSTYYPLVGKYMISWFKRFMDEDTRYSKFLCGAEHAADVRNVFDISDYRENCPY